MKKEDLEWTPSNLPGALTYRVHRLFTKLGEPRLAELGFGFGYFPVLAALRRGEPRSQKDLAILASIEQPTMAQTLARMERDGLVERRPNPNDKRSSLFSLTAGTLEKTPLVMEALVQGNQEALKGFSEEEQETLVVLLKRLIENLENVLEEREEN